MSRDEEIYALAVEIARAERAAFLERACAGDSALRTRVGALLAANDEAEEFFALPPVPRPTLMAEEKPGDRIGRYKLLQKIGEGGCGVVYLAEQEEPIRRRVALKVIKLGMDTKAVIARFDAERQALALMDHPNIARVLDAGATDTGRPFFVMELVRGIPITRYCDQEGLAPPRRLELFVQVCRAVQHAHEKGIVHRDLKPSNILVTMHDDVAAPKVIDFGIAKATQGRLTDHTLFTAFEQFIGTPAYMSPEQAQLNDVEVDARSDVYSLGVLLYELLTGRPPFNPHTLQQNGLDEIRRIIREVEPPRPSTRLSTLSHEDRASVARLRGTAPVQLSALMRGDLDWIVMKALEKSRARRYESANGLATDIERHLHHEPITARPPTMAYVAQKLVRRHRLGFTVAGMIASVIVIAAVLNIALTTRSERIENELRASALRAKANEASIRRVAEAQRERDEKIRWAREIALPEINRLVQKDEVSAAFALAQAAEEYIPKDPALTSLWPQISVRVTIETTPPAADVSLKPYNKLDADWQYLGKSPLKGVRLARDFQRWRVSKEGYLLLERADYPTSKLGFGLTAADESPPGMVHIQGTQTNQLVTRFPSVQLGDFWIDKFEVTNREFQRFVDRGGYTMAGFWKNRFIDDGTVLTWNEALARFRDATGQPGPAKWRNGTFAEGEADFPVMGVSWFEAAAYAEFAGKRLPSTHHWRHAAATYLAPAMVPLSNFSRRGPARVGSYPGMSVCGAYDMAGNAKEWCWNEAGAERRYILGGGWSDPEYMYISADALNPFDRSPANGFRCIKLTTPGATDPSFDAPVLRTVRTYADERPIGDAEFQQFTSVFTYDKTNLAPQLESVDDTNPRWRKERVSFNTAYNNERMGAVLFLPKRVSPPFQTLVYMPSDGAKNSRSSEYLSDQWLFLGLVENGRALIYPIYKGTYERGPRPGTGSAAHRDYVIEVSKDLGRAIDYLETREDIRADRLAYVGYSTGANLGSLLPAVEKRFKALVLVGGGFTDAKPLAMVDPINFAPRVTIPTLMLNGRYDFIRPLETSQLPMYRWLGAPVADKRHVVYECGHTVPPKQAEAEMQAWLDHYLGRLK